jgi:hypothetical protein
MINIYLISSNTNGKKLYKIGKTKRSIPERIKEFKTGNASELLIVDSFVSKWARKIEANFHRALKIKKVSGEWFDLDDEDILTFKSKCLKLHENFEVIESSNTYYIDRGGRF